MNNKQLVFVGVAGIAGVAFGLGSAIPRVIESAIGNFYHSAEILIFLVAVAVAVAGVAKWAIRSFCLSEILMEEMRNFIICSKDNKITFDQFPYYVSEQVEVMLKNAAFLQLTEADLSHYTRNLSRASQTILPSGPSELYQQTLAKALANFFHSDLLLLDISSFKIRSKCGVASTLQTPRKSNCESTSWVSEIHGSSTILSRKEGNAPIKHTTGWILNDKLLMKTLYKLLSKASKGGPCILYLRDVEKFLCITETIHILFQKMLKKLKGPVLILGSRIVHTENHKDKVSDQLASVFSYEIEVRPPEDETRLVTWKTQLEDDMKTIQNEDTKNHLLEANDIECDDLGSLCMIDATALGNNIEEIVVSAICSYMMNNKNPEYRNGKLLIPARSLSNGLSIFQELKSTETDSLRLDAKAEYTKKEVADKKPDKEAGSKGEASTKKDCPKKDDPKKDGRQPNVPADNGFEKRITSQVIPANKINMTFDDIGALDDVKESLQELVILPVRRPDLFKGGILKPCKGILLFGPPGTGKTMLAKAIAREAGASFINITASAVQSKWIGEGEKLVKALFSVAAEVSPTIIFIDEVDSLLSARFTSEKNSYRKFKNEFMLRWDGLMTDADQKILVLGATNRPFDLDDAVIRRFQRRIMVGLPTAKCRESIFRTLLEKQKGLDAGIDFKELATMTEGYTGSDLKNLCTTAAFRPVKELIQKERLSELEKKKSKDTSSEISAKEDQDKADRSSDTSKEDKGKAISSEVSSEARDKAKSNEASEETKEEKIIDIRPLNMEDFKEAKKLVPASFPSGGFAMEELKRWNIRYAGGDGGSKPETLTYFL